MTDSTANYDYVGGHVSRSTDGQDRTARTAPDPLEPGWSNADPHDGISSVEPPPEEIDMTAPGWSNDDGTAAAPAATCATAGSPGTWTPAGAAPCPLFQQMDTITASPATAWGTGEYVVLGDGSEAYFGGVAWTSGRA